MPFSAELRRAFYNTKAWKTQRARIRARAGGRCECRGDCGRDHSDGGMRTNYRCSERADEPGRGDGVVVGGRVGFGAAHLEHNSGVHVPDDKLIGMCSGCHLRFDVDEHVRAKPRNRAKKLERRGQVRLFQDA